MELAIYFSNLKRLEQMDDALRYIETKNISTYLFGTIFSLNPNLYDYSINLSSLTWLRSVQDAGFDFSRLYFGQEFCQNLIPSPDELEQAYYISKQLGWNFTYVTNGYLTEEGHDKIRANIEKMKEIRANLEVVVNDWGTLNIIHNEYPQLMGHMVLGRVLNKQTRLNLFSHAGQMPPVHMSSIDTPEKDIRLAQLNAFRDISLSNPDYLREVKNWGFTNVDLDMTPQAVSTFHERLTAEAGLNRHDENHFHHFQIRAQACRRRARTEGDARAAAEIVDPADHVRQIAAAFDMDRDVVRSRLRERLDVAAGLGQHQMHVKRQVASLPDAGDHAGPHRKVRDEMPVHDIHVQQIRAAFFHA